MLHLIAPRGSISVPEFRPEWEIDPRHTLALRAHQVAVRAPARLRREVYGPEATREEVLAELDALIGEIDAAELHAEQRFPAEVAREALRRIRAAL